MIEFGGTDLVVQGPVDRDKVRRALADALGVREDRVAVIADVSMYPDPDTADVVGVCTAIDGDFTDLLSVQLAPLKLKYNTRLELVQRLCELLGTRCLVPIDGEANPYVMYMVSPA